MNKPTQFGKVLPRKVQLRKILLSSVFAMSLSSFANAGIVAIVTESTASGNYFEQETEGGGGDGSVSFDDPQISESVGNREFGSAGAFDSVSDVDGDVIFFKNGNSAFGAQAFSTSRTVVDITFTNTSNDAVNPILDSQIVPAGMGFYLTDCAADNTRQCATTDGNFFNLENVESFFGSPGETILESAFNFEVVSAGEVLFQLQGSISLVAGAELGDPNTIVTNLSQIDNFLTDFQQTSDIDSDQELTFDWGATDFEVIFPDELLPNDSATVSYITEVSTTVASGCSSFLGLTNDPCGISYASFGDPIGRGGRGRVLPPELNNIQAARFASATTANSDTAITGYEAGLYTMAAAFDSETGLLSYRATSGPGIGIVEASAPASVVFVAMSIAFLGFRKRRTN